MIKEIAGKISAGVVICKIINVYSEANNQQVWVWQGQQYWFTATAFGLKILASEAYHAALTHGLG